VQFVLDMDFDARTHATGTVVLKLPRGGDWNIQLFFDTKPSDLSINWDAVRTKHFAIRFDPNRMAGLPSLIEFVKTGMRLDSFVWNDRLYHPDLGQFWLRYSRQTKLQVVSKGDICTVLRLHARYCQPDGKQPASQPDAIYDWYLFHTLPLVFVTAIVRQKESFAWNELHFLELNFPDESFRRWAGGEPMKEGEFTVSKKGFVFRDWGALIEGEDAIGMFGGDVHFYDGRGEYGTYLHSIWQPWNEKESRLSTWLWIGSQREPASAVRVASGQYLWQGQVVLTRPELQKQIENLRASALKEKGRAKQQKLWRVALSERQEAQGQLDEAQRIARGDLPSDWQLLAAGDLGLALQQKKDGIRMQSLFDLKTGQELLAPKDLPLFAITLRHAQSKEEKHLASDTGWQQVKLQKTHDGFTLDWQRPSDNRLKGVRVMAKAISESRSRAWRWTLGVDGVGSEWSVWRVVFPQVALSEPGEKGVVLFPRGPGELKRDVWHQAFSFRGAYPNGWCSMQLMAAYGEAREKQPATGLYFAMHDPFGSTKDIVMQSDPGSRSVQMAFDHPVPDMGRAGNDFTLSGEAVWQLLRGDWFDAAMIYKTWARKSVRWWPRLTAEGREDTPLWMRELSAWALGGGAPGECVSAVKEFARFLGVPTGFHWYNWHQIPFDNDYPHYFPAKEGFEEGVAELKRAGVFVMPYINGRLWDTRDRGTEDYEFTRVALPSATQDESGKPYLESYASKESDGSPVRLAVMCPTTPLWQQTVRDVVLKLQKEIGVNGVYIDQIAAASPALCMDATHGHPLGGGHWWNEGYWKLLEGIRSAKPEDRMLTTECNAEPFIRWMDGYLTWHWQFDGQVPVFPAIYGGTVQMFSRAYGGGPLAVRMKAGQQLMYGEQIGWIDPGVIKDKEKAGFFREAVRLRWHLRRYFYAGEMARPPKLIGNIPTVRDDWQWTPDWWVTTDAVLTGAWQIPKENRLVLLFANVSDVPVAAALKFDGRTYGIRASQIQVRVIEGEEARETMQMPGRFQRPIDFPPRSIMAWEMRW